MTGIQMPRLGKRAMAELVKKAGRLGMTPQRYVQRLIEQDLALDRKARTLTFKRIVGPTKPVSEAEIDRVVDAARSRHHAARNARAKR